MRDFRNAKAMAKTLREVFASRSLQISHSESLEAIAQILGARNWQTLSAAIETEPGGRTKPKAGAPPPTARSVLPLVPMRDFVVFPEMAVPLFAGRPKTLAAIQAALDGDQRLFLVTQRRREDNAPTPDDLFKVGVLAVILQSTTLTDGTLRLTVQGERRARVLRVSDGDFLEAEVEGLEASVGASGSAEALARETLERFSRFANFDLAAPPIMMAPLQAMTRYPGVLADRVCPHVAIGVEQAQALLETVEPDARLSRLIALMSEARKAA